MSGDEVVRRASQLYAAGLKEAIEAVQASKTACQVRFVTCVRRDEGGEIQFTMTHDVRGLGGPATLAGCDKGQPGLH